MPIYFKKDNINMVIAIIGQSGWVYYDSYHVLTMEISVKYF